MNALKILSLIATKVDDDVFADVALALRDCYGGKVAEDGGPGSGPHKGSGSGSSTGRVYEPGTYSLEDPRHFDNIQKQFLNKEGKPNVKVAHNGAHLINGSHRDEMQHAANKARISAHMSKDPKEAKHHESLANSYQASANKAKF